MKVFECINNRKQDKLCTRYEQFSLTETYACSASSNLTDPVLFEFCLQVSNFVPLFQETKTHIEASVYVNIPPEASAPVPKLRFGNNYVKNN